MDKKYVLDNLILLESTNLFVYNVFMKKYKPTPSELEILQLLWNMGEAKVQSIHDELSKTKQTGYTTTLKIMQLMYEKKILSRRKEGKGHVYFTLVKEEDIQNTLVQQFIQQTFRGSAKKFVMQALGNKKTSKEEIDEIRSFLNELETKQDEH